MSKVWLITGCSRGLGRAFAEAALANGDQVAATARKVADLADLKQKYGELVTLLSLNVTDEIQAEMAVQTIIKTFGRLDVLVNNAGYGNVSPIEDTSLAEFRAQIETNLFGVIRGIDPSQHDGITIEGRRMASNENWRANVIQQLGRKRKPEIASVS